MIEQPTIIGRAERIQLLDYGGQSIPAKVDTGADTSSIWASEVNEQNGVLEFVLFAKSSHYYTGQRIVIDAGNFHRRKIMNSFGHTEIRYVIKLRVGILGRRFKASFTLANRGDNIYPVLIGRRILKHGFLVDVNRGEPLLAEEQAQYKRFRVDLGHDQD